MESYNDIKLSLIKKDKTLKKVFDATDVEIKPTPSIDVYLYLLRSIASQQLSVKVVRVIWQRFEDLFPDTYPEKKYLLSLEDQVLRKAGLSNSKLRYMKNVAEFAINNDISFDYLNKLKDEEIIEYLTQIKGVGKWTVQMILMFPMDRPNVFPVDDLGIQTRMKYWYNIDLEKAELKKKLIEIAENWHPYKTLACKYLWQSTIK